MAIILSGKRRPGQNGLLSYSHEGNTYRHYLWVNLVSQTLGVTGQQANSRLRRSFYVKSNQVGPYHVEGQCSSQTDYQELALFIRRHQKRLITAPHSDSYTKFDESNPGISRLLRLEIPSEAISCRGFIPAFGISKKGVFDPAPTFQFDFTIIYDRNTTNILVSYSIQKYFDKWPDVLAPGRITGGEDKNVSEGVD